MKMRTMVVLAFAAIGALYLFHNYRSHGGIMGVKQGIGIG